MLNVRTLDGFLWDQCATHDYTQDLRFSRLDLSCHTTRVSKLEMECVFLIMNAKMGGETAAGTRDSFRTPNRIWMVEKQIPPNYPIDRSEVRANGFPMNIGDAGMRPFEPDLIELVPRSRAFKRELS